ncbi:MAG: lytic transglycosylase domain-containing protein [Proteobacteria bacterium]|nr:lytic transglycosylase domain-containing protein [Pseudomonadota bacterium]
MADITRSRIALALALATTLVCAQPASARTVYRCLRDGTTSLSTAPEPGSRCTAQTVADDAAKLPNLWGVNGVQSGAIYARMQDGAMVYGTRELPGSTRLMAFSVTPPDSPAHAGLGDVGAPQVAVQAATFSAAARANGIDDAWLRAIAHAESGMRADAVSPKGAQGMMQLMPQTAATYRVLDPFSATQSIRGGARYLGDLLRRFHGDRRLAAAAYNAGAGAVDRYGGVPPYAETQAYVDKVDALYLRYRQALGSANVGQVAHARS